MPTHLEAKETGELVRFDRPFQVWMFAVGHRELLLRSTKSEKFSTRVDILFKGVEGMLIHPQIDSLVIERAPAEEGKQFGEMLGLSKPTDIYVLSREPLLVVAASVAFWHEDEGEYFDPCHFDVVAPPGLAVPLTGEGSP